MKNMTNEEVVQLVKAKMTEKNEVIKEQQAQIQEMENQVLELQQKLSEAEKRSSMRERLVESLAAVLE